MISNTILISIKPPSISRSFTLFALHYFAVFCHGSQYLASFYCPYQSLSHSPPQQNFQQLVLSFRKVWDYPTSLIWWFINCKCHLIEQTFKVTIFLLKWPVAYYCLKCFEDNNISNKELSGNVQGRQNSIYFPYII